MRFTRTLSLLVVGCVVAASCSSDNSAEDTTAVSEPTVAVADSDPPVTEAPPSDAPTTEAPTSEPPVTEPPATDPATTVAPPEPTTTLAAVVALPESYDGFVSEVYGDDASWLCRPGMVDDVCARNIDATVVHADGTTELEPFVAATDPEIDCFYVYPTVSGDPGAHSDMIVDESQEIAAVINQAARLGSTCRVFAPVYRQFTLAALLGGVERGDSTEAFDDVLDSFRHFIANDSDGRPFVLVGHSQGAGMLTRLIATEIDEEPLLRDRMVSALLLGANLDDDTFNNVAPCTSMADTGCFVAYGSYRDTEPPVADSIFGRTENGPAVCVNPVDPAGGATVSSPYFWVQSAGVLGAGAQPFDDPARTAEITTPFVVYPDMVTVECVDNGEFSYLQLTVTTQDGERADDIGGDLTPQFGMHLIDANVAMGDLENLVATQAATFAS